MEKKPIYVHVIQFIRSKIDDKTINRLLLDFLCNYKIKKVDKKNIIRQYPYDNFEAASLKYTLNFLLEAKLKEKF